MTLRNPMPMAQARYGLDPLLAATVFTLLAVGLEIGRAHV